MDTTPTLEDAIETKIQQAANLFRKAKHAIALTGAGHSTPSGIPDFRSPDSGLWATADPMMVASISGFRLNPQAFFDWVRPLAELLLRAEPNPAHHALAELETMGLLQAVITQNIDELHQKAGSKRVLELHGHFRQATCIRCYKVVAAQELMQEFVASGEVPRCQCGGVMKPNVILFGEQLPVEVLNAAQQEARQCDVILVAGSSLQVAPASDIPLIAHRHGAEIVIVNYEPTPLDRHASVVIHEDVAKVLPRIVRACKQR